MKPDFKTGDRVRMWCNGFGETEGEEVYYEPGELGTVDFVRNFGGCQGWAVTITMDCGVTNVFDESDPEPRFPFELVSRA